MKPVAAVILAAGRGLRLAPETDHTPKPLVPVAGRPILQHIFEALAQGAGVRHFVVVVGYRAGAFSAVPAPGGCSITFVENTRWAESNSMASLALGVPYLSENGGIIVEGDCCFDARLFAAPNFLENAWYVRPFSAVDDGCCLWSHPDGLIRRLTIEARDSVVIDSAWRVWKSCGVLRISAPLARNLEAWLNAGLAAGRDRDYYDLILRDHLAEAALHVADIGAAPWFEVDSPADLQQADALFRLRAR